MLLYDMLLLEQGRILCTILYSHLGEMCPQWAELMVIHQDFPSAWNAGLLKVKKYTDILTMANTWLESQT